MNDTIRVQSSETVRRSAGGQYWQTLKKQESLSGVGCLADGRVWNGELPGGILPSAGGQLLATDLGKVPHPEAISEAGDDCG